MKILITLITLILVNSSFAQLSISISAGIDPKEISLYDHTAIDGDNAYWNNGKSIGANIEYALSERFIICALFHYSNYSFDKYANSGFMIPAISFLYTEGENSKLWRTSVEAKFFPFPRDRFKFFISTGLGIVVEDLGSIKTHYFDMNNNRNQTYIIDPEVKNGLVHSMGLGFRTSIISNLFLDISGSYFSDYTERFQTFLGVSIGYQFL